jgi:hypothetical protein
LYPASSPSINFGSIAIHSPSFLPENFVYTIRFTPSAEGGHHFWTGT